MRYALRVSLPDERGALSAVAAALARAGADIVSLDVVDREDGIAVDDLVVEVSTDTERVRAAVEELRGAVVEALVPTAQTGDAAACVGLARVLVERQTGAVHALVEGLPATLWSTWAVAVARGPAGMEVLAASAAVPSLAGVGTPWLPLEQPRRLPAAAWMPPAWNARAEGTDVAAAPLGSPTTVVLLGRVNGPRFRKPELRQLGHLAHIAACAETTGARLAKAQRALVTN